MDLDEIVVVAHYHPSGRVRPDTRRLISRLVNGKRRVIFVSTKLADHEAAELRLSCDVIIRENFGYDFYSWRAGMVHADMFDQAKLPRILYLINTSILVVDHEKLVEKFFDRPLGGAIYGLSISREIRPHIQSFLVGIQREILGMPDWINWWRNMQPISNRQQVIFEYELGLSDLARKIGVEISSAMAMETTDKIPVMDIVNSCGFRGLVKGAPKLNPSHFAWRRGLEEFGFLKCELIKKNPFKRDLVGLLNRAAIDEVFANDLMEGIRS